LYRMQRIDYKYMGSVVLLGLIHCLITDNPINHAQMSFMQAAVLPLLLELAHPYDGQQSHGIFLHLAVKICVDNVLPPCRVSSPPGTSTKSMSLPRVSWSSFAYWTDHRLCCAARDSSSAVLCGELGLDVYMQCMRPKEMRHFSVAWAMRPKLGNLLCGC
jgi:hypothetical protein